MQKMINDLLELSRITTHKKPYELVDLNLVANQVVDDLEGRIHQSQGQVILHPLPILDADPVQMHQLLQNLVGNALKYRQPDLPPLVEVGYRDLPPGKVEIYVRDNGIGFDMKDVDQIFLPFKRLHGRSEYEGSGIGLAICQKIAERHGGLINAQSAPGEGATFSVVLPLKHNGE
jgi:signal transduction histidine kinase